MACIFCILKDLINNNLHKLAETPLSRCFSACCGKNSLIALSDSLFCAKWIHTAVYAHIFRKYFFLLPERPKHLPPQPTQAYRKEICRFFAAISQKFHGRMPWVSHSWINFARTCNISFSASLMNSNEITKLLTDTTEKLSQTATIKKLYHRHRHCDAIPSGQVLSEVVDLCRAVLFPGYYGKSTINA